MGRGGGEVAGGMVAGYWVGRLVEESFFVGCGVHESRKKNEKNMFCLRCCASVCSHCASSHSSHPLLQVRRYVYNDVVRLNDLEKLIDCSHVQPYTINSAKVVFLKPRPQSRPFKGSGNVCLACGRILQEPYHFCSLSCKVDHVVSQGEDLSSILLRIGGRDLTFSQFEDLEIDSSDFVESEASRKKKSGGGRGGFFPRIELSLSSRRKGAPHRAPLS